MSHRDVRHIKRSLLKGEHTESWGRERERERGRGRGRERKRERR